MIIKKDLYISELKISNIKNAPYCIESIGRFSNLFTFDQETLDLWDIKLEKNIIGKTLAVSIESTDEIDSKKCELLVENVEKIIRRRFRHIPNTYYEEEVEHLLKFSSPREEGNIPCPYFDLRTELNEKEYNEFLSLRKNVKFHIECRIK